MINNHRTWIEIDSQAFNHNVYEIKSLIHEAALGIVLKAHAYGHGLELMGKLCQENDAVSLLFTAGLKEAIRLRTSGVQKPILVLAYIDDDITSFIDYQITCAVADKETAEKLSSVAESLHQKISIHIKIDTGMSRFGFRSDTVEESIDYITTLKGLKCTGIFTHLSDTNNSDYSFSNAQIISFDKAALYAEKKLLKKLYKHVLPSGALHKEVKYDAVRVGSNIYGYWKSILQQQRFVALKPDISLKPILTWKTRIAALKYIDPGDAVGYHRTFIAPLRMKIAILPVGYYDGYPRALSHKGVVLIRKKYAPVIGIISMNSMVVDVTQIGSVKIDDEVILCGDYPGLTAIDLATITDSVQNEFLTRISPLIPRVKI